MQATQMPNYNFNFVFKLLLDNLANGNLNRNDWEWSLQMLYVLMFYNLPYGIPFTLSVVWMYKIL